MPKIVDRLRPLAPDVTFSSGKTFSWSPANRSISYPKNTKDDTLATWSLLHETGHALLNHQDYTSDLDLLLLEVAAWEKAKELAVELDINIDEDHIQDCLDTYRDWLHQRSTCPRCGLVSLQTSTSEYKCANCNCTWQVSASRFCRPYRLTTPTKTKPKARHPATFK